MCEFCENIDSIKRSQKREFKEIQLQRHIKLVNELGEPAEKFRVIDQIPMSWELIQEFELAIKTGVPGRPPKKKKVITRPTIGDKYEIRYKYDLREGIDGPKILPNGRTRDFCEIILDANRYYTRNDINTMSNGFGLPVFEYAGGYYKNPETGITTPYCRHNWYMLFVERT